MPEAHTTLDDTSVVAALRERGSRDLGDGDGAASDWCTLNRRSGSFGSRSGLLHNGKGSAVVRARSSHNRLSADRNDVIASKGVLAEARVVLDKLLNGVVVGNVDLQRGLNGEESHALGAGRGGEGTGVLEDVGGFHDGEDAREVDALLNGDRAAGLLDGVEVGGDASDDGVGGAGAELEHESEDDDLGLIG